MASIALIDCAGAAHAAAAGLRHVTDDSPGITRQRTGKNVFRYRMPDGAIVKDKAVLSRIRSLAIPPAWKNVWICTQASGHLQATGRDLRSRKQHRYHPEWRVVRDQTKYERMIAFGRVLPAMRRRVARDLRRPGLGREKVLAAVTRLLEATLIRVGNEEYARQNGSFGLSTLRDRHVRVKAGTMHFEFRGKSGKHHSIDLHDPRLAKIVRGAQELPGQTLFQYTDEAGGVQKIVSEDVNAYLRETGGGEFSAKDFRTWAATVLAADALREFQRADSSTQAKKNVLRAVERVAERLGNTPAICRKSYIHPLVLDAYLDGLTVSVMRNRAKKIPRGRLTPIESAVLNFLQKQLAAAHRRDAAGGRLNQRKSSRLGRSPSRRPAGQRQRNTRRSTL